MTETEQLLETCIHEAAHFAFVVWAGGQVNRISIGANDTGDFVSGGHVEWEMVDDMNAESLAEIAAAGSAEDVIRGRYTFDEVFDSSVGDQEGFASLMRNGSNLDEFAIKTLFMKGIEGAFRKLADTETQKRVVDIGAELCRQCTDGRVVIEGEDLAPLIAMC